MSQEQRIKKLEARLEELENSVDWIAKKLAAEEEGDITEGEVIAEWAGWTEDIDWSEPVFSTRISANLELWFGDEDSDYTETSVAGIIVPCLHFLIAMRNLESKFSKKLEEVFKERHGGTLVFRDFYFAIATAEERTVALLRLIDEGAE